MTAPETDDARDRSRHAPAHEPALRKLKRFSGFALIATAVITCALCWLALHFLGGALADHPSPERIGGLARGCLRYPAVVGLLALPGIVCGALASRRRGMLWLAAGTVIVIVPVCLTIYSMVAFLAPMYAVEPL